MFVVQTWSISSVGYITSMNSRGITNSYINLDCNITIHAQSRKNHINVINMNEWVNKWMIEWMIEWMNERMNERMNEWMNEWMNDTPKREYQRNALGVYSF